MPRHTIISVAVCLIGVLASTHSIADECPWYKFGRCVEVTVEGVQEAAETARKGAVEASENIYSTFNFWTQLVQWYHAGTDEQKAKARQILQGTFGLKDTGKPIDFAVTVSFRGTKDDDPQPFYVAVLRDYKRLDDSALAATVAAGERSDLNFRPVIGSTPGTPTNPPEYLKAVEAVRRDVHDHATFVASRTVPGRKLCSELTNSQQCTEGQKKSTKETADRLTTAIMAVLDDRVQLRGALPSATFPWSGQPFLTILIPEEALKARPNLEIELTIHARDSIDAALPDFMNNPREISAKAMLAYPVVVSSSKLVPSGTYKVARIQMY